MIGKLGKLLSNIMNEESVEEHAPHTLELACSVLLCEVIRADGEISDDEKKSIAQHLANSFGLGAEAVNKLVNEGLALSEEATDLHQFTKVINETYSVSEKIDMVCHLWQLAMADGNLASIEEHIIRRIADLLHLRHSEYIQAKTQGLSQ